MMAALLKRITALERAASRKVWAAGDIKQSVAASQPEGWLFFNQAILNADTGYPALWAAVPAAWKSGTTLNLPNLEDRVLAEGATVGTLAGANTHTLAVTNLPAHSHTFTSGAPSNNTSGTPSNDTSGTPSTASTGTHSSDHTHSIAHDHGAFTSGSTTNRIFSYPAEGGSTAGIKTSLSLNNAASWSTGNVEAHTHSIDVPYFAGNSGGASANHTHSLNSHTHSLSAHTHSLQNHTHSGTTNNTGSGTAVDHTSARMTVRTMIKT